MATDKVEYLVKEMNAARIKVVSEYEPGWMVIEITVESAVDVLDIFYAGMACVYGRMSKESNV